MTKIRISAKVDEGKYARAMVNRNCDTPSQLIQQLIDEAARAPPKRSHKKKPPKCNNIVHDLQKPVPVITATPEPPSNLITEMKFLLIDRDKRSQECTRKWMADHIRKNYPLEASVGLEAMLDVIFTAIKRR